MTDPIDVESGVPGVFRKRLFGPSEFAPWVEAENTSEDLSLFWMPVKAFPLPHDEKIWVSAFLSLFSTLLQQQAGLEPEIFFRYKGAAEVGDALRTYALHCIIRMGVGRYGDEPLGGLPDQETIDAYVKNRTLFDFRDWMADYLYWFVTRQPERQRELFLGYGSMLTLFMAPEKPQAVPKLNFTPALRAQFSAFKTWDVEGMMAGSYAAGHPFQAKSKSLFGTGLETKPEWPGIAFVLPLLQSAHFFAAPEELRRNWFSVFQVYIGESVKDGGLLLAFQNKQYKDILLQVLEEMRRDGMIYDERI